MPVSVVVGGQFGSEGKGKVAYFLAREMRAAAAIRVGGPNSGHTVVSEDDRSIIFRQLPTAAMLPEITCALPAGAYVDVEILLKEIEMAQLGSDRLIIDPNAVVVTIEDKEAERESGLKDRIGSTLSGTGGAVIRRTGRVGTVRLVGSERRLGQYVAPVAGLLRKLLDERKRLVIEGTQGYGLSLLHGDYPYVTSRDTTAAAFVAEVGLSPLDVDDVVLVLRAFPIRVPGHSGPLPNEIDWETVTVESRSRGAITEWTSVTRGVRRVGRFDPGVVRRAIESNQPTRIVLNHLDYIDSRDSTGARVAEFVAEVERGIGRAIDYWGVSPGTLLARSAPQQRRIAS